MNKIKILKEKFLKLAFGPDSFDSLRNCLQRLLKTVIKKDLYDNWFENNISVLKEYLTDELIDNMNLLWIENEPYILDKDNNIYISKDFVELEEYEYLEENFYIRILKNGMLKGLDKIPNLYIFKFKVDNLKLSVLNKEVLYDIDLSHYEYVVRAIQKFLEIKDKEELINLSKKFIGKNKGKIEELSMEMFEKVPRYIGGESSAVVFDIGKGMVLKLFASDHEFNKAKEALDRIYKVPELGDKEALIYDIGILGEVKDKKIYYCIMEKMMPVTENKALSAELLYMLKEIKKEIFSNQIKLRALQFYYYEFKNENDKVRILKRSIQEFALQLQEALLKDDNFNYSHKELSEEEDDGSKLLAENWLYNFIEEIIVKLITERADLHVGNLGITNVGKGGQLRYFDPAHEYHKDGMNV